MLAAEGHTLQHAHAHHPSLSPGSGMTCPMHRGVSPERRLCKAVLEMEKQNRDAGCASAGLDIGKSTR